LLSICEALGSTPGAGRKRFKKRKNKAKIRNLLVLTVKRSVKIHDNNS
jgi:hypothetical protein